MIKVGITGLNIYQGAVRSFFIQDASGAWNGLYVYTNQYPNVLVGDSISIIGEVGEYNNSSSDTEHSGITELKNIVSVDVLVQGKDLPSPAVVQTGDYANEMWEAVYAKFENATCTDNTLSYGYVAFNDNSGIQLS